MKNITCNTKGRNVVITIPKDLLIYALEDERREGYGYSPIKIWNKKLFFKEFCKNLLETGEHEDGSTSLTRLFDDCAEELYCNGSGAIRTNSDFESEYLYDDDL